jgi:hypothetical protein
MGKVLSAHQLAHEQHPTERHPVWEEGIDAFRLAALDEH